MKSPSVSPPIPASAVATFAPFFDTPYLSSLVMNRPVSGSEKLHALVATEEQRSLVLIPPQHANENHSNGARDTAVVTTSVSSSQPLVKR